jgi:hexokinase
VRRKPPVEADAFFELQAELLAQLIDRPGFPLGYCFSYPAESDATFDARLLRWTKGIEVPGVVGQPVGARLRAALERRGLSPGGVVVLNDTVACLMGAALQSDGPARRAIGLIAGTGTNMAGFFDARWAPKLAEPGLPMALNLESGNFCPPGEILTAADDAIDSRERPGAQRFEKAASGHYLPYLLQELLRTEGEAVAGVAVDPEQGCAPLVALAEDGRAPKRARELVQALFRRSADLVAVGLAALLDHYPPGQVSIVAEGSLFWRTPGYASRVKQTLNMLVGSERCVVAGCEHVNLVGAASAAVEAHH